MPLSWTVSKQLRNQFCHADAAQFTLYALPFLWLVPEEEHALGELVLLTLCAEHRLKRVGVKSGIPHLGADGHRGRGEVLHLLQLEVEALGDEGKTRHICLMAAWVAADEIGDNLLAKTFAAVDVIEKSFEGLKLCERGLAHESQHLIAGVLGGDFQPAAHMAAYQFTGVGGSGFIGGRVATFMQQ